MPRKEITLLVGFALLVGGCSSIRIGNTARSDYENSLRYLKYRVAVSDRHVQEADAAVEAADAQLSEETRNHLAELRSREIVFGFCTAYDIRDKRFFYTGPFRLDVEEVYAGDLAVARPDVERKFVEFLQADLGGNFENGGSLASCDDLAHEHLSDASDELYLQLNEWGQTGDGQFVPVNWNP